jgi:hypothetical protein
MQTDFFGALVDGARKSETHSLYSLPFCDFVRETRKKKYDTCRSNFMVGEQLFQVLFVGIFTFFQPFQPLPCRRQIVHRI